MIMPCMNSTSACDRGGSVALVDGGSVLLGLPGAPGCTTTGVAESVCCARAREARKPVGTLVASSMPLRTTDPLAEWSFRLRQKRKSLHFRESLDIFSVLTLKGSGKTQDGEMRPALSKSPARAAGVAQRATRDSALR